MSSVFYYVIRCLHYASYIVVAYYVIIMQVLIVIINVLLYEPYVTQTYYAREKITINCIF